MNVTTERTQTDFEWAADWPQEATRKNNWQEAVRRWSLVQKAHPEEPIAW